MKRFRLLKNLGKGIEGAILSGAATETAIRILQSADEVDISNVEHAATVFGLALAGFFVKSLKNWLKNRG